MVLLHVDDDVLDLRQQVDAFGAAWVGPVARLTTVTGEGTGEHAGQARAPREHEAGARGETEQELPP